MTKKSIAVETEAEVDQKINVDLEAAQDEIFGTDLEIAEQAAAAEDETPAPEKTKEDPAAEKEDETPAPEKTEEELAAEKKAAEEKPAEKTEEELAAEKLAEKVKEEKEADPYEVPEDMKGRTRERFEKLTGDLKETHGLVEKQTKIIEDFRGVLEKTQMTPAEVQKTLDLGRMMKTSPRQAYEELQKVVNTLATQLGEVVPGANPLEGYDDLKRKVADRELSVDDAKELAAFRIKQAAEKQATERQSQQTVEQDQAAEQGRQFTTRVETAQTAVAGYVKAKQADPDFEKIGPYLIKAAEHAAQNLAPEQWLGYIEGEFNTVKQVASDMTPKPGPTPILDGGSPAGGEKEPQNLEQLADAML